MNTILKVEHLSKKYEHFCLRDISFSLPSGCIMGLIGENGAGKTTTLKLILNLIRRDGGSVEIFGKDGIQEEKSVKEQIGVVLDEGGFHEMLTPRDIGNIMKGVYLKSWDGALYQRYLERFSLPGRKQIKEFSRGMKVKLSIAAALSHHPRFLLLDEATSGLDPVMRDEILDIFQEFITEENHAVLLSSHITSDLEKIADYITFIHKGELLLSAPKDDLLDHYGVLKCGKEAISRMDRADVVARRSNSFGCEALVRDRREARRKYPDAVIDAATLDDIMLFYVKGEKI